MFILSCRCNMTKVFILGRQVRFHQLELLFNDPPSSMAHASGQYCLELCWDLVVTDRCCPVLVGPNLCTDRDHLSILQYFILRKTLDELSLEKGQCRLLFRSNDLTRVVASYFHHGNYCLITWLDTHQILDNEQRRSSTVSISSDAFS